MIPGSEPIETQILNKITPTAKEKKELEHVIETLKKHVIKEIEKTNIPILIELVGSTAKDTYIQTAVDIDLFLVFPATVPREILQEKGLSIGRAILEKQEECFAEHPYVRGRFQNYKTEIVPCYKIESASQKLSAVDRTPLHTRYVKKHLKDTQKKEVRLFKQFLKGIGCYGAEAEIEGFSGYLCEILIIKYGTFQELLQEAQHWQYGQTLTLEEGPSPHFETPLTFIDPVDPARNVASALSKDKFDIFVKACSEYVKNPRTTFFFSHDLQPWPLEKIKKEIEKKEFVGLKIPKPDIIAENLYPQVRKAVRSLTEFCEQNDFTIIDATFSIDKSTVTLILHPKTKTLSKTMLHSGPPVALKKNADEFQEKWTNHPRTRKKPFEKDKRLYVEIEREFTDIQELLHHKIKNLSLGKHLDQMIRKKYTVITRTDLLTESMRPFWTKYLDTRMSWER